MSPFVAAKHDLGLLRQDGSTKVGLMLARGRNNEPSWTEVDDEYLASQQVPIPGYAGLPYEKELRSAQSDWRSGFGLERFDKDDPLRYLSSTGMDMRHRGMAILSNTPTIQSLATALAWLNTGFEDWSGGAPDNWTEVLDSGTGITVSEQTNSPDPNEGSSYARIRTDDGSSHGYLYQDGANWDNAYQGITVTIAYYVQAAQASTARIAIEDGQGRTKSSFHTGGGDWELLTVTRTLDASASRLRVELWAEGTAGADNANFDGVPKLPLIGTVRFYRHGLFNGDEYFSRGAYLFKVNDSDGAVTPIAAFEADITSIAQFDDGTDDRLYIAIGADDNYYRMSTAEVFTQTDSKAFFFAAVGTTLWKGLKPRSVFSATDPIADANWSGITTIDAASINITDIIFFDNTIYIMKEDRPFFLDSNGAVQTLTNTTVPLTAPTSGANPTEFGALLYMPWGSQGLLEYESTQGVLTFRDPSGFATRQQAFAGRVFAVTRDEAYIYAIIDNSSKIEVLAGRQEVIDGTSRFVWHPLYQITLADCQTAIVSPVFQKRLWITSTDSTDSVYYVALPSGYGYLEGDVNRNFKTGGFFETPWLHAEFQGDSKAQLTLKLDLGHAASTTTYFTAAYKLFNQTSYTTIGNTATFAGSSSDRTPKAFLNVASTSTQTASPMIRFKITGVTASTAITPILLSYDARAVLFPPKRTVIRAEIRVASNITDKQGNPLSDGQAAIVEALDEARGAGTLVPDWPITISDAVGKQDTSTDRTFRVLPQSTKQVFYTGKPPSAKAEYHYVLLLQEVSTS